MLIRAVSKHHHRSDGFAFMHQIEGIVDFLKRHCVGDQIVNIDLPFHVPIHNLWHVSPPARAAKGGTFPDAARDQVEGTRRDFSA